MIQLIKQIIINNYNTAMISDCDTSMCMANISYNGNIYIIIIGILETNTSTITKPQIRLQTIPLNINSITYKENYNYIINYEYIYNLYEKCLNFSSIFGFGFKFGYVTCFEFGLGFGLV